MYQELVDTLYKKGSEKELMIELDFTHIFESYYKRVYNFIYYRVNNHHQAEDLTSLVFEKSMIKIQTYCEDKSSFEVWLFAIAKNAVNDYFRSQKKAQLFSIDSIKDLVSMRKTPEDIVEISETNDEILRSLRILKSRDRDIVALKFGANLSNKKIAEILCLSESNVGVILYRVLKKLKRELEREVKGIWIKMALKIDLTMI